MLITQLEDIQKDKIHLYLDRLFDWLVDKAFDLLIAIIFLFLATKLIKAVLKLIKKSFTRAGMESSVSGFLLSLIRGILYVIVFIMAINIVGFQVTSLITILGTAGLAAGLALQGSLSNFAGGVLILIMKPFKVGDYIIENDKKCEGEVVAIDIFYTKLKTIDNKIIVIPNGNITANSIVNVTAMEVRKVDISVGVSYSSDIKKVKAVLEKIANQNPYVDKAKDINVFVSSFEDSHISMGVRFFVNTPNYWNAKWLANEQIKEEFDKNGIIIPYNQLEVTLKDNKK